MTGGNGSEFAAHEQIAEALSADFYFAHPIFILEARSQ